MPYAVVTGGAGFIGSNLVKHLTENGYQVRVIDNFTAGRRENLAQCDRKRFDLREIDLRNYKDTLTALKGTDVVFHLAADPDVKSSVTNPSGHYENNVQATYHVLEAMRQEGITDIIFTSSSVVYGETSVMPTPEDHPLNPISIYGTSKLACEVLISGYTEAFGLRSLMLRPANIIGGNGTHGAIFDFIRKLRANPTEMEILGDGTQQKSYLHVSDFVNAVMTGYQHFQNNTRKTEIFNVGSLDSLSVMEIAKSVMAGMGLVDTRLRLTGGVDGGRGWKGDIKTMLLSVDRLKEIGWQPSLNSKEAVALSIRELISQL